MDRMHGTRITDPAEMTGRADLNSLVTQNFAYCAQPERPETWSALNDAAWPLVFAGLWLFAWGWVRA